MSNTIVIVASGGRVPWVARAYGCAIALIVVLTVAALVRIRRTNRGPTPFRTPVNVRLGGHELPLGLLLTSVVVGVSLATTVALGDLAAAVSAASIAVAALWLTWVRRGATATVAVDDEDRFDLLLAA